MAAIFKRELQGFFYTSIGYVFMFVFFALSGLMFYINNIAVSESDILSFLWAIAYLWIPLVPVLTMRLLAEERQKKTDQLLRTAPVSPVGIVLGKYLAAALVLMGTVLLTLVYVAVVAIHGKVYPGEVFAGYVGFILQGLAFLALNLFISGCVKSQIASAILSLGANFALWTLYSLAQNVTSQALSEVLRFLCLYNRLLPFILGQFSFSSIVYYLCFIAVFLTGATVMLNARRWKEG